MTKKTRQQKLPPAELDRIACGKRMSTAPSIPGMKKCQHCGEWWYEMVDYRHTCKPLWFALVLPADASERDIAIAITEADNTDGWVRVRADLGVYAAAAAAELAWESSKAPYSLVVVRYGASVENLFFDVKAHIQTEFWATDRNAKS